MKTKCLIGLVVLMAGCSGGQTTGGDDGGQTRAQLKQAAAEAKADGNAHGDVCADKGWYGDDECDTFCPAFDSVDCTPSGTGDPIYCAEFIETPNGYCSRKADDPCIGQDPDCQGQSEPAEPVACTLIAQLPDGVCKTDPNDPCLRYSDPDCPNDNNSIDPSGPSSGPGAMPTDPSGSGPGATPTDPGAPGSIPGATPGDPNAPGGTPVNPTDPGSAPPGGVACATYIELGDGVCKRDPADPCIFQDPDCTVK